MNKEINNNFIIASRAYLLHYEYMFIMEQLDKFVYNPFNGEVASFPIPPEAIS